MNNRVSHKKIEPLHLGFILFMILGWAGNVTAVKVIVSNDMGAITAAALRFTIAFFCILLWVKFRKINIGYEKGDFSLYFPIGLCFLLQILLFNLSSKYTDSGRVGVILNVYPFWVTVISGFIFAEDKHTFKGMAGALVAVCGVIFIFKDSFFAGGTLFKGDLLSLISSIVLAVGIVFQKRALRKDAEPMKVLLYPMVVSLAGYYIFAFVFDETPFSSGFNMLNFAMLLFQGAIVGGIVFILWQYMLREYNPSQLSSFFFLVPFFTVLFGYIFLNEPLKTGLGIGLVMISSGIYFINR